MKTCFTLCLLAALTFTSCIYREKQWEGASADISRGKLQVSPNKRYLQYADGTPFFYLGDTAWELFHRLSEKEAEEYLENRRAKGFTVIQAVILAELEGLTVPNRNGDLPLHELDPTRPNEAYFQWVDKVIRLAESKGLYIGLLPTWGDKVDKQWGVGPEIFTPENAAQYGTWLGERYRNFPNIIWINGGDRSGGGDNFPVWDALGNALHDADPNHLITYHPMGENSSAQWFHDCGWLDFNMAQTGHCQTDYAAYERIIVKDYNRTPTKPCLDGEPRYENHPVCWQPDSLGWFDDADVRQAMYANLFSGSLGHTYGCHDIWQFKTAEREAVGQARGDWKTSMDLPGASDLIHARRLMESLDWADRRPAPELITSDNETYDRRALALQSKDHALVYFPNNGRTTLDLSSLSGGKKLYLYWMNPRSGEINKLGTRKPGNAITVSPPTSGKGSDWVLIIKWKTT